MWSYIVRRLLLMIPVLFGISIINFAIINIAPAPRAPSVNEQGMVDVSASAEAGEGARIFRETFNLDKPIFFNTRYSLQSEEVFWRLTAPLRPWTLPAKLVEHRDTIEDYGRTIVPHLLEIADAAAEGRLDERFGADYTARYAEARATWIEAGRAPGLPWPPPETPPSLDSEEVLKQALVRLYVNAQRRPIVIYGRPLTKEQVEYNREVREETFRLRELLPKREATAENLRSLLAQWRAWADERASMWEYTFWEKARMFFLDTRFAKFWDSLLSFDLGSSFIYRRPVDLLIMERLHVSLTLSFGALLLTYLLSIPLGIFSAAFHRGVTDRMTSFALFALFSLPTFFIAVLLLQYLAIDTEMFPTGNFESPNYADLTVLQKLQDNLRHLALPLAALTLPSLALYSRYMKAGLIENLRADYARTARAKGLSGFVVVMKHAVRNSLIPLITLLGASLPVLISGSVIIEFIFNIDGMGRLAYDAAVKRDFSVIMGLNILTAVLTLVGIFLADLMYAVVDPRVSYK